MLEQALEFLKSQAIDAAAAEHCEFTLQPEIGDHVYLITNPSTGRCEIVDASPDEFGTVASIEDLVKVSETKINADTNNARAVYVSQAKAVLQLGSEFKPKSRYVLPLRVNPVVSVLTGNLKEMDHKTCMRRLRVELASTFIEPEDFKTSVSSLKFTTTAENATTVRKGDESIGKSIMAKVTGESDIADEILVTFPVYPDVAPEFKTVVRCSVIIDSMDQKISIVPIPGEVERGLIEAQKHIAGEIKRRLYSGIPVICGTFCE